MAGMRRKWEEGSREAGVVCEGVNGLWICDRRIESAGRSGDGAWF